MFLESDAKDLVKLLMANCGTSMGSSLIVWKIMDLMRRDWQLSIRWIPRECNMLADGLAKEGISFSCSFLDTCPSSLRERHAYETLGLNSHTL